MLIIPHAYFMLPSQVFLGIVTRLIQERENSYIKSIKFPFQSNIFGKNDLTKTGELGVKEKGGFRFEYRQKLQDPRF